MRKRLYTFLLILMMGLSPLFSIRLSIAAEPSLDPVRVAASQTHPGSKEPEGLEVAPSATVSIGWDVTLASKYLFYGIDYSDGKPVVQPEATFSIKDVSAIFWFNYDLDKKEANEFDLYLQYSREIKDFSLITGYAHYNYPHREEWDPSQEVFIEASCNALLNPSLGVHYDFDAGNGAYFKLGMNHEAGPSLGALSLGINLFYMDNYYENSGFPSMEFNVNKEFSFGSLTITPSVSYFLSWDNGDFRDDNAVSDTWLFSLNIAHTVYER